jgi:hypothetical protein
MATVDITGRTNVTAITGIGGIQALRNGIVTAISSVAPRGTIPAAYYWPRVTAMTAVNAMSVMDAWVKVHVAQLTAAAVANARELGIVLAVTRAVTVASWTIVDAELVAGECAAAILDATADPVVWAAVTTDAAIAPAAGVAALTAAECAVIPYLVWMAAPVAALQGLSLVETGHHYLPTTARYFEAMKKQVMNTAPANVQTWVTALGAEFDSCMFHKACHPITPAVKESFAKNTNTPARLRAANCGAAAVRMPATPGDVKAAKAAVAVMLKAGTVLREMGGSVDVTVLQDAITAVVSAATPALANAAVMALNNALAARKADIAYCLGIVVAELTAAGIANHSLVRSHYMKRLRDEETAEVVLGTTLYTALRKKRADELTAGTVTARVIA